MLFLLALIIILCLNFYNFCNLKESMEHSLYLGINFDGWKLGHLGVKLEYDYHRNLLYPIRCSNRMHHLIARFKLFINKFILKVSLTKGFISFNLKVLRN